MSSELDPLLLYSSIYLYIEIIYFFEYECIQNLEIFRK